MIDVKAPLRTAYYSLLNGNLSYNSVNVPVSDSVEKLADTVNNYVLLKVQTGQSQNTHQAWFNEEIMQLDIISRGTRVNKSTVDSIASQILTLIFPTPQGNALPVQPTIKIINARVTLNTDFEFKTTGGLNVARKVIEITQFVSQ